MQRYKGYLLVTDMDGTLIDSKQKISSQNIKAISSYVKEGGLFTIATGRTEINILPYIRNLDINCPCILYNGAMIYDLAKKEYIRGTFLKQTLFIALLKRILEEYGDLCVQIFVPGKMFIVSGAETLDPVVIKEGQPYQYASLEDITGEKWLKIIFNAPHDVLKNIKKLLEGNVPPETICCVFSTSTYLELLPYGVSKGSALADLVSIMDVESRKVVAIGDYCNDIEMIQAAGLGVATANAHIRLKEAANMVSVSNDEHALDYLIKEVLPKIESVPRTKKDAVFSQNKLGNKNISL